MLILHLSDLHFGSKSRFAADDPEAVATAFHRALVEAATKRGISGSPIEIVIVSGDIVETGLPSEFETAHRFLVSLAKELRVGHERFVLLPGNHDVSWPSCRKVRAACAGEDFPAAELDGRMATEKLANYRRFIGRFYGGTVTDQSLAGLAHSRPLTGGGWLRDFPGLRLSVAALNTVERETDEFHGGFLSAQQAQDLMDAWKDGTAAGLLKIVALHHNPIATTPENRRWTLEWLREREKALGIQQPMSTEAFEHYVADLAGFTGAEHLPKLVHDTHPHLILHGHHHDQGDPMSWHWRTDGSAPVLSVGSFGIKDDQLPDGAPLSCQLLRFVLPPEEGSPRLRAIPLVYDGRMRLEGQVLVGAFRAEGNSRAAYDQPLPLPKGWKGTDDLPEKWAAPSSSEPLKADPIPKPPFLYAEPAYIGSHAFVGRQPQLELLSDWATAADTHSLLLFEAIGGTGKSMLTWEWVTKHAPLVRTDWAGMCWYSFYEKGATMADFCRRSLAYMTGRSWQSFRDRNTSELAAQLIRQLRSGPWLIVLDGLERVLVSYHRYDAAQLPDEQAGASDEIAQRDPCAAINPEDEDLLRTLAGANPSKLLLTSRLIPRTLLNKSRQPIPGVLRERLPGLRPPEAEQLVRDCGVTGTSAVIQGYLKSHCDCHPLVTGVVAGLVNDYLPDRGNFDAWAIDPTAGALVHLGDLDLVQKRNHILKTALAALPEKSKQLLSTLALLSQAVDYPTLCGLNPHLPLVPKEVECPTNPELTTAWGSMNPLLRQRALNDYAREKEAHTAFEDAMARRPTEMALAPQRLTATVRDLDQRGLLQYDATTKRFDLHPVVRAVSVGSLGQDELVRYGERVVDLFSQRAQNPYEQATSLEDFGDARRIVQALFHMGRLTQARDFIRRGAFLPVLSHRFEAHNEILEIIRPFFSQGWEELPACLEVGGGLQIIRTAATSLRRIGAFDNAFSVGKSALHLSLLPNRRDGLWSQLLNLASTAGEQNRRALEDRLLVHAAAIVSLRAERGAALSVALARFRQVSRLGWLDEAGTAWVEVTALMLTPHERAIAAHHHALHAFHTGTLSVEELAKADELSRGVKAALGLRNLAALRGAWHFESGRYAAARDCLQEAVTLAHRAGKVDRRSEIRLALARFRLGELADAGEMADYFTNGIEPSHQLLISQLWRAAGNSERATHHALAGHRWGCADGEPYVNRYELTKAAGLLRELGTSPPLVPKFDPASDERLPWERAVEEAIAQLRAQVTPRESSQAPPTL